MSILFFTMAINLPKLMNIAREASLVSDHPVFKMGAVLFNKQGRLLSSGRNWHHKTHPMIKKVSLVKSMHAELDAVLGLRHYDLRGTEIFVYRENNVGEPRMAKPCPMCMTILKSFGVKRAWYTTENGVESIKI